MLLENNKTEYGFEKYLFPQILKMLKSNANIKNILLDDITHKFCHFTGM